MRTRRKPNGSGDLVKASHLSDAAGRFKPEELPGVLAHQPRHHPESPYKVPVDEVLRRAKHARKVTNSNCVGGALYIVGAAGKDELIPSTQLERIESFLVEVERPNDASVIAIAPQEPNVKRIYHMMAIHPEKRDTVFFREYGGSMREENRDALINRLVAEAQIGMLNVKVKYYRPK